MEGIQLTLFGKTSPEHSALTRARILGEFSKRSQRPKFQYLNLESGQKQEWSELNTVTSLGELSTLNIGVSPSAAAVSTLSQILEINAPQKYYLSPKAGQGILRRAEKRGKELPSLLKAALEARAKGKFLVTNSLSPIPHNWDGQPISPTLTRQNANGSQRMPDKENFNCVLFPIKTEILDMTHANDVIRECGDIVSTLQARMGTGGNQIPLVFEPKAYGICSQSSNSMKSSNPHSGIYEADTSRTLDCNGGNPTCNQGGVVIVEPVDNVKCLTPWDCQSKRIFDPNGAFCTLPAMDCGGANNTAVIYTIDHAAFNQGENAKYDFQIDDSGINSTIVARGPGAVCYNISGNEIAGTLDASYYKGNGARSGKEREFVSIPNDIGNNWFVWIVRRLTPLECERLQGFPDGWTTVTTDGTEISDSARYKALGNSIAIPCAARIFEGIIEAERSKEEEWTG